MKTTSESLEHLRGRLLAAFLSLFILVILGSLGFYVIGIFYLPTIQPGTSWSFLDCLYMMMITVTTTGYGEVLSHMNDPFIRVYTTLMLVGGLVVYVHMVSTMTTFFVEGTFSRISQRRKMQKKINSLKDHIIVCGLGSEGIHIVKELLITHWSLVVIDIDKELIETRNQELCELGDLLYIVGDALDENILEQAGIKNAFGLISALPTDKDNLFVTITARQLNNSLRIVSKAVDLRTSERMKIAGADTVVSTNFIGGLRMVSEMIRPQVTEFLDLMLRDKEKNLRLEEITISTKSGLSGSTINKADIVEEDKLIVLAIKNPLTGSYLYGPSSDYVMETGQILVVMGEPDTVARLRNRISGISVSNVKL